MIYVDRTIAGARLLIWKITETCSELEVELTNPQILDALKIIKWEQHRLSFLAVRVAIKKALNEELLISYHPSGRPYFADKDLRISISHTQDWVAILLHPHKEVGVDIQVPSPKIVRVYTRFLSSKELENLGENNLIEKYLLAWSAKEALYKIIGAAAVDFRENLEIQPFDLAENGELELRHLPSTTNYSLSYEQNEIYTLVYSVV